MDRRAAQDPPILRILCRGLDDIDLDFIRYPLAKELS